jgi:hypothetical protein
MGRKRSAMNDVSPIQGEPPGRMRSATLLPKSFPISNFWEGVRFQSLAKSLILLATTAGIEPATFSLEGTCGCCSISGHSDKSTVFRAVEPKRLSAAVRMKANDSRSP